MRLENAVKLLEEQYIKAPKDRQIDNMNLNPKELEYYNGVLDGWNNPKGAVPDVVRPKYSLEFKDFFIPLQDCIERDSKRLLKQSSNKKGYMRVWLSNNKIKHKQLK